MREASANLEETHTEQSLPFLISRFVLNLPSNLLVEGIYLSANLYFRTLLILCNILASTNLSIHILQKE
jgi:hypothetical protein